jgi:hypothetical protein
MSRPIVLDWTCPECGREFEVSCEPYTPACTSGPPESCYPEEGGEFEPDKCECGATIPVDEVFNRLMDRQKADEEDLAESQYDMRKDLEP